MAGGEGGGLPGQQNVIGLKLAAEPIETKAITEANPIRVTGHWWLPAAKLLQKHSSFSCWARKVGGGGGRVLTAPLHVYSRPTLCQCCSTPHNLVWFWSRAESTSVGSNCCCSFSVAGGKFSPVPQVVHCVHIGPCRDGYWRTSQQNKCKAQEKVRKDHHQSAPQQIHLPDPCGRVVVKSSCFLAGPPPLPLPRPAQSGHGGPH